MHVLHAFVTELTLTDPVLFFFFVCFFVLCFITVYQHNQIPNLRQRAVCSAVWPRDCLMRC